MIKSTLLGLYKYDGLGWLRLKRLKEPITIVGVMHPVDPGCITIRRKNGQLEQVPSFALKPCPNIDWSAMMTKEQKAQREQCGMLFGNGGLKQKLIPINQCPTVEAKNQHEKTTSTKRIRRIAQQDSRH